MLASRLEAAAFVPGFRSLLIRLYYYDAVPYDKSVSNDQKILHEQIKNTDLFELRLGRIKYDEEGKTRQKGVDVLIAIDMISKAYENHYDIAVFLAGDDDFVDVVKAVKNTGKQVFGIYFNKLASHELKQNFDKRLPISGKDDNILLNIRHKEM
jgi:uncharacterized LabA/DUF88 family protein